MKDKYGINIDRHITAEEAGSRSVATLNNRCFADMYLRKFVYNKIFDDIDIESLYGNREVIITETFYDGCVLWSDETIKFNGINSVNKGDYFCLFIKYFEELGYSVTIKHLYNQYGHVQDKEILGEKYSFVISW